jgi:type IV secretion system protein VirD4
MQNTKMGFQPTNDESAFTFNLRQVYEQAITFGSDKPFQCLLRLDEINRLIVLSLFDKLSNQRLENVVFQQILDELKEKGAAPHLILFMAHSVHLFGRVTFSETEPYLSHLVHSASVFVVNILNWYENRNQKSYVKENVANWCEALSELATIPSSERYSHPNYASLRDLAKYEGNDGLIISQHLRLNKEKSVEHCLIIGPTGSGKSASFFIPNLLSLPDATIIVSDPKGELFEKTAHQNRVQGKKILRFDPFANDTLCYNPLDFCENSTDVWQLAQIILTNGASAINMANSSRNDLEWINMSVPLFTSLLLCAKMSNQTIADAIDTIHKYEDIQSLRLFTAFYNGSRFEAEIERYFNTFASVAGSEKTLASIKVVLSSNVQAFMDNRIRHATSCSGIDLQELRERPTVLYVTVPFTQASLASPLLSVFYYQLFKFMQTSKTDRTVYFMLDEFANIGKIPDVDKALATFRSQNVSISIGIQSNLQLETKYDRQTAQVILDNLKTKIVLPGLSYDSAEYFNKLLGMRKTESLKIEINQVTKNPAIFVSHSSEVNIMSSSEIRQMNDEQMLVVVDNIKPYIDFQRRYYKDDLLNEKVVQTSFAKERAIQKLQQMAAQIDATSSWRYAKDEHLHISLAPIYPFDKLYTYGGEYTTHIFNGNESWHVQPILSLADDLDDEDKAFVLELRQLTMQILDANNNVIFESKQVAIKSLKFSTSKLGDGESERFHCLLEPIICPQMESEGDFELYFVVEVGNESFQNTKTIKQYIPLEINKNERFNR